MGKLGAGIIGGLLTAGVGLLVAFKAIPVVWPLITDASTNITSMNGTDAGTTTMVSFTPVLLIIGGLGIAVGLITFVIKKFKLSF